MPPRVSLPRARLSRPSIRHTRLQSTKPSSPSKSQQRISKTLDRMPKFLHPYTTGLRNAPGTHITSFLILHELTAIIPLLILGAGFHYTGWLPGGLDEQKVLGYMTKFGSYFSRKGWFGVETSVATDVSAQRASQEETGMEIGMEGEPRHEQRVHTVLTHQEEESIVDEGRYGQGTRVVLEVATAYALTKALLPVRIVGSVWATPWFARRVLGAFRRFRR